MEGVSAEEAKAVKALQRVARKWPESLWLFSASGTLCVMKKVDGKQKFKHKNYRIMRG